MTADDAVNYGAIGGVIGHGWVTVLMIRAPNPTVTA